MDVQCCPLVAHRVPTLVSDADDDEKSDGGGGGGGDDDIEERPARVDGSLERVDVGGQCDLYLG